MEALQRSGGPGAGRGSGVIRGPGEPDAGGEVEEEVRFHLDQRARDLVARGMDPDEARAEARRRFGDVKEVQREMQREDEAHARRLRRMRVLSGFALDVRWALRQMRGHPALTGVVLLTLALGIGASTAIFSVVDHVLLRPLPYPTPEELVALWADVTERGGPDHEWLSYANFADARDELPGVAAGAVWGGWSPTLTRGGEALAVPGAVVGHGMFTRVLGVEPALGRGFTPSEDRPDGPLAVIVSHAFWRDRLGSEPGAVGRTLTLGGAPHRLVGVMPEGFVAPFLPGARIWRAARVDPVVAGERRGGFAWRAILRLEPGTSPVQVAVAAEGLGHRLARAHPQTNTGMGFFVAPLGDDLVRAERPGLVVLLAGVCLVLLVACMNVANLLLARATARRGELKVRAALGAGRVRLVRQLVVEAGLLATAGGALGVTASLWLTPVLVGLAPEGTPRLDAVSVDLRVLSFTFAVTVVVALGSGLLPALRVVGRRGTGKGGLQRSARGSTSDRAGLRARRALVAMQVACALVATAASGLLLRSFDNLRGSDLGYDPAGVLTFFVPLVGEAYDEPEARLSLIRSLEDELSGLAGVRAVGAVESPPLAGFDGDAGFVVEGRPEPAPGVRQAAWIRPATPGYLDAMGLRLEAGRFFGAADGPDDPRVVVINRTFAERHFPGADPVGRRVRFGGDPDGPLWEVVGVVADTRHFSVRDDRREAAWLPMAQLPQTLFFVVMRGAPDADPLAFTADARRILARLDPTLAPRRVATMDEILSGALARDRYLAVLLTLFAGITVVLAVVGLYGVVSHAAVARIRELGVRMALGARSGDIRRLVVRENMPPVAVGLGLGLGASLAAALLLRSLLYRVPAWDPATLGAAAALLTAASVAAAFLPAWRASRTDPAGVLRGE